MSLNEKITQILSNECKLEEAAEVHRYVMNRRQQVIKHHINNVYPIKEPCSGWNARYYYTKLTPKIRGHEHKVYGKTQDEVEDKIVAYYLKIQDDNKITLEKLLLQAIRIEREETGKRKIQRFHKWFPSLCKLPASRLSEEQLRKAIEEVHKTQPTRKEFNNAMGVLNTIADYCAYEHIEIIDIRSIISIYRKFKCRGKRDFKETQKSDADLSFSKDEAQKIMMYAIKHPDYKTFAVAIMISTGLRAGELLGLETQDIDLKRGRIRVHQMENTKTYNIESNCKDHSARYVYLTADAELILKKAIAFREQDGNPSPFLLLNKNSTDGKLHLRALDNHLRVFIHYDVLKLSKERDARSAHDCRRTYASLEYLAKTDIRTLKKQMGHNSEAQTWDYIKDVVDAAERKNMLKGGNMLSGISQSHARSTLDAI